jgi:hypothetical protein
VLQVQQARHQPRRQRRPPRPEVNDSAEVALDLRPVDQGGQADEGMTHVEQLVQAWAEQLGGLWLGRGIPTSLRSTPRARIYGALLRHDRP